MYHVSSLLSDNDTAHLLCYVFYVKILSNDPNHDVQLADLLYFIVLARHSQTCRYVMQEILKNVRYPPAVTVFTCVILK